MNRSSVGVENFTRNSRHSFFTKDNYDEITRKSAIIRNNDAKSTSIDLSQADLNRLRIFFGSKLYHPLICRTKASVFTTPETHITNFSVTNFRISKDWKEKAQGAILLQVQYDKKIPQNVCGARIIVANVNSCDMLWSTSLHSWNKYRCVDEHFHVLLKLSRNSGFENEIIPRDYSVGIYFPDVTAAQQFNEYVMDYVQQISVYEKQDTISQQQPVQPIPSSKLKTKKKSTQITKSMISAPVMFCHTLHIDK